MIFSNSVHAQITFGIFADCQYQNGETKGTRYYKNSLKKLDNCIETFNNESLDFIVSVGDLIDQDIESFDSVQPILNNSKHEIFHVLGNHDLEVEEKFRNSVPEKLGLKDTYYSISKKDWRFVFLNGNEITFQSNRPEIIQTAEEMLALLEAKQYPNNKSWNGGIDQKQITWLNKELAEAENQNQKVVIFCHYPLLPLEAHTLWNSEDVLDIIHSHKCVKLYINGHNHAGEYQRKSGIHYLTLSGMVETKFQNSYAKILLSDEKIEIKGYGREQSRELKIQ